MQGLLLFFLLLWARPSDGLITPISGIRHLLTPTLPRHSISVLKSELQDNTGTNNLEEDQQEYLEYTPQGIVIRKSKSGYWKKRDNRDQLPFKVFINAEDLLGDHDRVVGNYRLDASTACGDVLDLGSEGTFEVRKVIFLYRYVQNSLRVVGKKLEVTPISSSALPYLQ